MFSTVGRGLTRAELMIGEARASQTVSEPSAIVARNRIPAVSLTRDSRVIVGKQLSQDFRPWLERLRN